MKKKNDIKTYIIFQCTQSQSSLIRFINKIKVITNQVNVELFCIHFETCF